jgi:hypothetical protein
MIGKKFSLKWLNFIIDIFKYICVPWVYKVSKTINNKKVLDNMQKKTRSLLEELDSMYVERDKRHVIENRASNVIASAIRLLEEIDASYTPEQAENLHRKLLNAIKLRDPGKFTRTVRRTDANP